MRKNLFFVLVGIMGIVMANATEPSIYPDFRINWLSSDGSWAGSTNAGVVNLINVGTAEILSFDDEVSPGLGNYLSNNGIFVGKNSAVNGPAYYKDGVWSSLPLNPNDQYTCLAQGITADGSRICGQVGREDFSLDFPEAMSTPVVWYSNGQGYDEYFELPHPTVDVENMAPQYVTALAISDDGKKIVGQVRSNSGRYNMPIMYEEDKNGEWSWRYLWPLNLEGVELPEPPGTSPAYPIVTDFCDEERAAYYNQMIEESGIYLSPEELLTEEEYEEWLAAWDEYWTLIHEYWEAYSAYVTALEEYITVPRFDFNNILMSANGRYVVSTEIVYDMYTMTCNVYICDTENNDTWTTITSSEKVLATFVSNNGDVLASSPSYDTFRVAYICQADSKSFIPIQNYVQGKSEALYLWMDENMRHDHPSEDGSTVTNGWCTGTMCASADLSVLASWEANAWDESVPEYYYSYILPMDCLSGVKNIVSANDETCGPVYNLQGVKVANSINVTTLPTGIYIVNGKKIHIK